MKRFFANFIAMFFISPNRRRYIRTKIMNSNIQKNDYLHLKSEWLKHNNNIPPLPGTQKEYDLVFCIGPTCHGTTLLKSFNLRTFSTPFDWTLGANPKDSDSVPGVCRDSRFHQKIQALCNNFKDWLNPQYFKYMSCLLGPNDIHHHIVNTKTNIQYIHEFPVDKDIAQHFPEFVTKTKRRINNLYTAIKESDSILIVWVSQIWDQKTFLDKTVSDTDIKWAVKQMQKLYPNKTFNFVFFEHDGTKERFEYEKIKVAPGAFRIKSNHFFTDNEYNFAHRESLVWTTHVHVISEMLDNIHLSKKAFVLSNKNS